MYALSLKQPWATLLVHGLKTIEVRNWPTARRGRILIHATCVPDGRPIAWSRVPLDLIDHCQLKGGIIGWADLNDCVAYDSLATFDRDKELHLNESSWFVGPKMFGFAFANAKELPFYPFSGWMRFFEVKGMELLNQKNQESRS